MQLGVYRFPSGRVIACAGEERSDDRVDNEVKLALPIVDRLPRFLATSFALGAIAATFGAGCSARSGESIGGQALGLGEDGGASVCQVGAECAPGAPCPDLTIDGARLQSSAFVSERDFSASDCAIFEGCVVAPGHRKLLRFDTATPNIGTADLVLGPPSTANACFEYSSCHNHYHFTNYAKYVLYAADGTTVVATGHKQAFCLEDMNAVAGVDAPVPSTFFNCSNQGLHRGYQDVYGSYLDCQWVDVTDVPPGSYTLSVTVNFAHVISELDYANNEVRVPVTIAGPPDAAVVDGGDTDAGGDAGTTDACMAFGSCGGCTAQAACGWCNDGQIGCHTGTGQGPNGGACVQANWSWVSTQCQAPPTPDAGTEAGHEAGSDAASEAAPPVDECAPLAACGGCTASARCGWCRDTQHCYIGTGTGPNGAQCTQSNWAWISNQCVAPPPPPDAGTSDAAPPADACNAFTDCHSCTLQPVCGFCGDGACRTGTGSGPNGGACAQAPWTWISSACH